jgi:hypothetical protein
MGYSKVSCKYKVPKPWSAQWCSGAVPLIYGPLYTHITFGKVHILGKLSDPKPRILCTCWPWNCYKCGLQNSLSSLCVHGLYKNPLTMAEILWLVFCVNFPSSWWEMRQSSPVVVDSATVDLWFTAPQYWTYMKLVNQPMKTLNPWWLMF